MVPAFPCRLLEMNNLRPHTRAAESEYAFFNDEDIEEIHFEGYRDDTEKEFASGYEEKIKNVPYPKVHLN